MNSYEYATNFFKKSCQLIEFDGREVWLELRKQGIGGSDVGPILGHSTFRNRKDVYKDKKETTEQKHSFAIDFGNDFEDIIFQAFKMKYKTMYEVLNYKNIMFRNIWFPFLQASLDGVLVDKRTGQVGILEIKTAQERKGKWYDQMGNRVVPQTYFDQAIHYFNVTGAEFVVFYVLINYEHNEADRSMEFLQPRIYFRKDCLKYMNYVREECMKFWYENVLKNVEPNIRLKY